jgi:hypothetical protein
VRVLDSIRLERSIIDRTNDSWYSPSISSHTL